MSRVYTVSFSAVAVSAPQELIYLAPATDKTIWLEWLKLRNVDGRTNAGDARESFWWMQVLYKSGTPTAGSGGSAVTPAALDPADPAASFTARANDTTLCTTNGTTYILAREGFQTRTGFDWYPDPEHVVSAPDGAVVLRLNSTPTWTIKVSGTAYVREA